MEMADSDSVRQAAPAGISALVMEYLNDPEDADTLYRLSRLWQERNQPRRGDECIQHAIQLNPCDADYWRQWGLVSYR
jgi:hypothetical protein